MCVFCFCFLCLSRFVLCAREARGMKATPVVKRLLTQGGRKADGASEKIWLPKSRAPPKKEWEDHTSTSHTTMSALSVSSPPSSIHPSRRGGGGRRDGGGGARLRRATRAVGAAASSSSSPTPTPTPCDGEPPLVTPSFEKCVPPGGDERERDVCFTCGFIDYRNPKVVVGCLPVWVGARCGDFVL